MKVVVNAGPLIALGKLGLLHLIHEVYGSALVPPAVYEEVVTQGSERGAPDAYTVRAAVLRRELIRIDVAEFVLSEQIRDLPLDIGEQQALQLALDQSADLVLLDDLMARESAHGLGLAVKGSVGVVVQAHRSELLGLDEVEMIFGRIAARQDIWISEVLLRRVWDELKRR